MNILLTNIWIAKYSGTEVYIRDLAIELKKKGFGVEIFSPILGKLAQEIRQAGIHITDDTRKIKDTPDLIHAHQYLPSMEVICRFPETPLVYFLHDRTYFGDVPPAYSKILKYVAVDYNCLDRLIIDQNIPAEKTDVIYNWVDTDKFKMRGTIAGKPKRALVFSNYANEKNYFPVLKNACEKQGIHLDGIGIGLGKMKSDPENILPAYDIVFAKAKAAMEAMATGAAVILCDYRGFGGMVTTESFDFMRQYNFGMRTLEKEITEDLVIQEIKKYNPERIKETTNKIRQEAGFKKTFSLIISLYKELLDNHLKNKYSFDLGKDNQLINEYKSIKHILYEKKINTLKTSLLERKAEIIQLHTHEKNLIQDILDIKTSLSYRLGRAMTFPARIVYEAFRYKNF